MNSETLEMQPEPVAKPQRFDLRNVSREAIEAAYIEAHNGARRPALRRMARAVARKRIDRDVYELLKAQHEGQA